MVLHRSGLKSGIDFAHFGLELAMAFKGTTGVDECIVRFISKWVRKKEKDYIYIYIYIYIESKLLCRMKILKTMKNKSLLCFCATRFTAVAALQA